MPSDVDGHRVGLLPTMLPLMVRAPSCRGDQASAADPLPWSVHADDQRAADGDAPDFFPQMPPVSKTLAFPVAVMLPAVSDPLMITLPPRCAVGVNDTRRVELLPGRPGAIRPQ